MVSPELHARLLLAERGWGWGWAGVTWLALSSPEGMSQRDPLQEDWLVAE